MNYMGKKALLVYGKPIKVDDKEKFKKNTLLNLNLISEIAKRENYEQEAVFIDDAYDKLKSYNPKSDSFLFYFTGHANKKNLGDKKIFFGKKYKTNKILDLISRIEGKKLILLDACTGNYKGGENFEILNIPSNSKIISAREIYDHISLAKILYDAIIFRGKKLENITEQTFEDMKHNWVYFKEVK